MPDLSPFYFPTCALLLDDDSAFLQNFSFAMDSELACLTYNSARKALRDIDAQRAGSGAAEAFFSPLPSVAEAAPGTAIRVDLRRIYQEIYNPRRFSMISVALVDYDMPDMDGLEFCRAIRRHRIKIVLLTGKADEKVAVKAFNAGLIDRFIFKSERDVNQRVNEAIADLQRAYFQEQYGSLAKALTVNAQTFLEDDAFAGFFDRLRAGGHWVEYYLLEQPRGFLMLDRAGTPSVMLIATQDDLRAHYEIARDEQAPAELLELLAGSRCLPFFAGTDGYFQHGYEDWRADLHPAEVFHGRETYYYAIIQDPPLSELQTRAIFPYQEFLRQLDLRNRPVTG